MASRLFTSICNSWRNLFPSRESLNDLGKEKVCTKRDILPTEVNTNEKNDVGASENPNKPHNVGLVPSVPPVNSNKFTDSCEFPDIRPTQNLNQNDSVGSVRNRGLSSHTESHHQNQLSIDLHTLHMINTSS